MPQISVIIPTYNRREYVQLAIDSVLAQSYTDYEIIVIDDGSTDGTSDALRARYGERVRLVTQTNQGESVARNRGVQIAHGQYIALLDSDDLWLPDKLAKEMAMLEGDPRLGMVFCQAWLIDAQGHLLADRPEGESLTDRDLTLENLCFENVIGGPSTTLLRRDIYKAVGGFDNNIHYGEDWDLFLRIAAQYRIGIIAEPLSCIRRHRGTQCYYPSADRNARRFDDHLKLINKALATWPGQLPDPIRHRILARQYAEAFLAELAVKNDDSAQRYLEQAQRLAPELLRDTAVFGQLVVNYTAVMAEDSQHSDLKLAAQYLQKVMGQLQRAGAGEPAFVQQVTAQASATIGFIAYQRGNTIAARRHFMQAIRHDRRWLRNSGVISIIAESILGKSILDALRKLTGRLPSTHARLSTTQLS